MRPIRNQRTRAVHGARAGLVWGLAAFLVMQLGLAFTIDCWWTDLRDPTYGRKAARLRQRMHRAAQHTQTIVMLGSSRAHYGLHGALLEQQLAQEMKTSTIVFNFGLCGAGPITELLVLKRLLADGIRPDIVLVEILPALLTARDAIPLEAHWLPPSRLRHGELSVVRAHGFPGNLRCDWYEAWPLPWYTHRYSLLSLVAPAWLPFQLQQDWGRGDDASGWAGACKIAGTPEQRALAVRRAYLEYSDNLKTLKLGGSACAAVQEIMDVCHRESIVTALVLMPEGSVFRSWYPPEIWASIETYLALLSQEYAAPIINARAWVADEDFSDAHHLILHGACVFSERLAREALVPLLRGTALPPPESGANTRRTQVP